jgi:hypothetical protein
MTRWKIGDTGVRNPMRLRDGLIVLANDLTHKGEFYGNLHGPEQNAIFRNALAEHGVVSLVGDKTNSVARKWINSLSSLGFIYPHSRNEKVMEVYQKELGKPDTITENGWRLIKTESVAGWQECFLRSLAAFYEPTEQGYFSPLRHTLAVMLELKKLTGSSAISGFEMEVIVQLSSSFDGSDVVAKEVVDFREQRNAAERKKVFDRDFKGKVASTVGLKPKSLYDYRDMNLRHLKATGLVQSKGRGIALVPSKYVLIEKIIHEESVPQNEIECLRQLCDGAILPTDHKQEALSVLQDLAEQLEKRGCPYDLKGRPLETPQDIEVARHDLEDSLFHLDELEYAKQQASMSEEISAFLQLLIESKKKASKTLSNGKKVRIPDGEAPAYFEWIIWRAFLAIDSLTIDPWDARRFKIDRDFLPVGTAPGNGPDIVFEFEDMVLVVEVTLTSSSRQEAAEGEPVRRHVAKYAEDNANNGKKVFGLFLAINVDTNTANSFRLGEWYMKGDRRIALNIVPMSLLDFKAIWDASLDDVSKVLPKLKYLMMECRSHINEHAPEWKKKVSELAQQTAASLKSQ